jgi:hypothetical protein
MHKHTYDEHGLCFECDKPKPSQVDHDNAYRKRQKSKGVVRKTVLVPLTRVKELHAICAKWRAEV